MTDSLADLLSRPSPDLGLIFGVVTGVVTNNKDPDGLSRVRVRFPWLPADVESPWARISSPMAGGKRGVFFLPEVDDEVLVAFQHGRVDAPIVLGALWNGSQKPPRDNADGSNSVRSITSRSGQQIVLDDTDGEEKIEIIGKDGTSVITIDSAKGRITLRAEADVAIISADGKLTLSGKEVVIEAKQGAVAISATATMSMKAGGDMVIEGKIIDLN